jgi:hypothetical protein
MTDEARFLPMEDLVAQLRKAAGTWFKNSDLLLLEELIRRVNLLLANQKEFDDNATR